MINISITGAHLRGKLGYWIGKTFWGKGYGTEAVKPIIEYEFEKLELNRIYAGALTSNPGSW
ncbi:GNAT family N-acetyltransferase [Cytobacillus purgationiresistens]|uniref:RimJ/RimL family protein N-acetyltransferase n=1 Tax=Cytobacillus purgationiresistens TaxID=863449 RepID=A0ABU0AL72_9BACI|nr:GNAT family N-acetyltransferase [Cytobacillus purgationiresistens]MDQ0271522.1 RimJ/RimL family protein N-acetyltransferase [Cytobacillus purgationiresistens]